MKRLTELMLVALIAAALVGGGMWANAAFTTFGPPVTNNFMKPYLQELRGFKTIAATMGTATVGSPTVATTVTGIESGDVIIDIVNFGATGTTVETIANIAEGIFTISSTDDEVYLNTSTGAPTVGDNLMFFIVDIDNTN